MANRLLESTNQGSMTSGQQQMQETSAKLQADLDKRKADCEAKGGTWDGLKCILPEKPTVKETPQAKSGQIETYREAGTGALSGASIPGQGKYQIPTGKITETGSQEMRSATIEEYNAYRASLGLAPTADTSTFLGLNPNDVGDIARGEAERAAIPQNAQPIGTAQGAINQQQRINDSLAQLGQTWALSPQEEAAIQYGQASVAGLSKAIPGLIGVGAGAALSATGVLSVAGVPLATASGISAAAAVQQFISGTLGNIKEQQKGEIGAAKEELALARTQMRQLAVLASRDQANADYYVQLYNNQKQRVLQAQVKTKLETQGNLNAFMEDGTQDLAEFDIFLRPGGLSDTYELRIRQALQTGQPLSVLGEELILDLEE